MGLNDKERRRRKRFDLPRARRNGTIHQVSRTGHRKTSGPWGQDQNTTVCGLIFSHKTLPASFAVNCMECIAVNEVELLQHELTEMRNSYFKACTLVAEMHAEAVGGPVGNGPKRGVVEDVEDLRNERDALKKENGELRAQLEALRQGGHDDGVQHSIEPPQADAR